MCLTTIVNEAFGETEGESIKPLDDARQNKPLINVVYTQTQFCDVNV